uniref:Uncharacterized protein n=1 Tax=Oryza punctata TaxID=4537 RepID=A0A0E0LHC3_ORYPU
MAAMGGLAGSDRGGCSEYVLIRSSERGNHRSRESSPQARFGRRRCGELRRWCSAQAVCSVSGGASPLAGGIEARLTMQRDQQGWVAATVSARNDGRRRCTWTVAPSAARGVK